MRNVHVSKERRAVAADIRTDFFNDDTETEMDSVATRRVSIPNTYLDWCYNLTTEWILWHLISNEPKEKKCETEDASAVLPRVDSGIGFNLLGQDNRQLSRSATSTPTAPITLLFRFENGTTAKHISYSTFSKWSAISALFSDLERDGIVVDELWDVNEDMPIGCGDWDARIQPGSVIHAWTSNDKRRYHLDDVDDSSDCESYDGTIESNGDGEDAESEYKMSWESSSKNTRNEHTWWFTRWRQRVEKAMPGRDEITDEPSWFLIVVWCTATIIIIALLVILNQ